MSSNRSNARHPRFGWAVFGSVVLGAALLTGCGGGGAGLLVPEEANTMSASEVAALNRATALNRSALAPRVTGERAAQTGQ